MINNVENHLRDACQLTGANWVVIADREKGRWFVSTAHSLPKSKYTGLTKFLAQEDINVWLESAFQGNDIRSVSLPEGSKLEAGRLYGFAMSDLSQVILVGANHQNATERRIWELVAGLMQSQSSGIAVENYLPNLQTELAYDLPRALDRVLSNFVHVAKPQGAWLAIHRGEMLDVSAQWNDSRVAGLSISVETNRLLRRLNRTLTDLAVGIDQLEWQDLPHAVRKSTKFWVCFPLIIGQRLIGAVALWGQDEFSPQELVKLRELAKQVSQSVEIIVTFNELTGHLGRLAMLNDFALTISSAQNLEQIARRMFGHLARSFDTELIALYLPSTDGRLVREFRNIGGKFSSQSTSLSGHPILPYLKGRVLRVSDSASDFKPVYAGARSGLVVPLKYRNQAVGLLTLESMRADALASTMNISWL